MGKLSRVTNPDWRIKLAEQPWTAAEGDEFVVRTWRHIEHHRVVAVKKNLHGETSGLTLVSTRRPRWRSPWLPVR